MPTIRNPGLMSHDEIIQEIGELRRGIERDSVRIHELARALYHRVRRSPSDDTTRVYVTYAHAWTRFSGMVSHGLARTSSADRILGLLPKKEAEPEEKPPAKPRASSTEQEAHQTLSPIEDLMKMYGAGEDVDA